MSKINSTDLHIQYKNETGQNFQYDPTRWDIRTYHSTEGYDRNYSKWVEEKLVEALNKLDETKHDEELFEYAERKLVQYGNLIDELEAKNEELHNEIRSLYQTREKDSFGQ